MGLIALRNQSLITWVQASVRPSPLMNLMPVMESVTLKQHDTLQSSRAILMKIIGLSTLSILLPSNPFSPSIFN